MSSRIDPGQIPSCPNLEFELALWYSGLTAVAGLDEAGRGAWAGPVTAAAVILPNTTRIETELRGVRDSKQISADRRAHLAPLIKEKALAWGIGNCSPVEIDELGILPATRMAMTRALSALKISAHHLLIDALFLPEVNLSQTSLIKGDQRSLSIASASILAKTTRDEWMRAEDKEYPEYGFAQHKGYGTALHQLNLSRVGPSAIHRKSYAPIRELLTKQ